MKIDDEDMNWIIKGLHRRNEFDKEFDIVIISKYEYDDESSSNKKSNSKEMNKEDDYEL